MIPLPKQSKAICKALSVSRYLIEVYRHVSKRRIADSYIERENDTENDDVTSVRSVHLLRLDGSRRQGGGREASIAISRDPFKI